MAGGGAAAGVMAGRVSPAESRSVRRRRGVKRADVCVIGGGISGLTTARRLIQAGVRSVVVLEASDRVGGRTVNLDVGGGVVVEGGGAYVGPGQDRVLALIKELGLSTFNTHVEGKTIYQVNGNRQTYEGTIPPMRADALVDFVQLQTRLEQMAATVPNEDPWNAKNAAEWDAMTFGQWLDANSLSAEAKFVMTFGFSIIFGEDPHETSFLRTLNLIRTCGGIDHMFNATGGAQESRIVGGSQQISLTMAKQLGRRVILNSPVSTIDQRGRDVFVTSARVNVRCKRVVVAMIPADADRIQFAPLLPMRRQMLQRKWRNGTESKCFAVYKEPFWRKDGLSGQAFTDLNPSYYVIDSSPPDGSLGILLAFIGTSGSGPGLHWSDEILDDREKRRAAFVANLTTLFGSQAANPIGYFEKDWSHEPWINGCIATRAPGTLTRYTTALRDPAGRIHWAGTETGVLNGGYMDGAVSAGERAAKEVVDAL